MLSLNINSFSQNALEIMDILNTQIFSIVAFQETKLDHSFTQNFFRNNLYSLIRKDKYRNEGGLIVFINKAFEMVYIDCGNKFKNIDYIHFKLLINKRIYNFINSYKSPKQNDTEFLDELEELIYSFNTNDPLILLGDLNMNLLKGVETNVNFEKFLDMHNLINVNKTPTRIASKLYKK